MIDPGLKGKSVLVTGGNNPVGIGACIARTFGSQGANVFIHYFCQEIPHDYEPQDPNQSRGPGLPFFFEQQRHTADQVVASVRRNGGEAESWEGDLREPDNVHRLFELAEERFGRIDILVNNAAEYTADSFLPSQVLADQGRLWDGGPLISTIDVDSHDRHFAVNSRAVAMLTAKFARSIIETGENWGRIVNISADCSWGCPKEISYRASKHALESYSRSAAAELGPYGITVNVVSPGPVQSGYMTKEIVEALLPDIPLRRVGRPEDIADAVLFLSSEQAGWITGQVLSVHGGHRMAFGL